MKLRASLMLAAMTMVLFAVGCNKDSDTPAVNGTAPAAPAAQPVGGGAAAAPGTAQGR